MIPPGEDWTYNYARRPSAKVPVTGLMHVYLSIGSMELTDNAGHAWHVTAMGRPRRIPSTWENIRHPIYAFTWPRYLRRHLESGDI